MEHLRWHRQPVLRSLGNVGAITNAASLAASRRREEWVVAALERSVTRSTLTSPIRRPA